jgi:HAD superfamily hydrolase (TIGR01509 family)
VKSRYELVIFDCDGVVVDSEPIGNRVFRAFLADIGITMSEREIYANFLGRALADSLEIVEQRLGRRLASDVVARYRATRDRTLREEIQPIDGVEHIVKSLRVPYCIASSGDYDKMCVTLGVTGLLPLFDGRVFSANDVPRAKPAPDVYLHAAERMGVAPASALVIEDTVPGVTAAHAAGMTVIGFTPLTPADELIAAGATDTAAQMCELALLLDAQGVTTQSTAKQ